jgi:hypothetical protein
MIPYDRMPEDNSELAKIDVDFPRLDPDTAESCPTPLEDVLAYLRMESADGDAVDASQLTFRRTAQVADRRYWTWSLRESEGADCYVTVSVGPDGDDCIGYEENYYGLTPEQFMLGDYHQVF